MKKQEFNHIFAHAKNIIRGQKWNGTLMSGSQCIRVDYSRPITLERCAEILELCERETGREYATLEFCHSMYSKTEGNELGDFAEKCFLNKTYLYNVKENSLLIFEGNEPVYANDNGKICRDQAALCDSIYD